MTKSIGSLFDDGREPLIVSYGAGVDSTAMLVAMWRRGIIPDMILFADVGSEKPETYAYIDTMGEWLLAVGFPPIQTVRNPRPRSGDKSLADALLRTAVLPALAFGQHQCSLVWKVDPQERLIRRHYGWSAKTASWATCRHVIKAIGYDAGPRDRCRAGNAIGKDSPGFRNWFPLIEWDIDRERCIEIIAAAGLPIPAKSSCTFCPAMKREEVHDLARHSPESLAEALKIEDGAIRRGLKTVKGLGRSWNWREHLTTEAPPDVRRIVAELP